MPFDMNVWNTELRRGIVELCILAVLDRQESYGYEIVEQLSQHAGLPMTESTVYPILTRLKRDGLLAIRMQRSELGPPRRYFRLTEMGRKRFKQMVIDWQEFTGLVNQLLGKVITKDSKGEST